MSVENIGGIILMDLGKSKWQQPTDESVNSGFIVVVNLLATRFVLNN